MMTCSASRCMLHISAEQTENKKNFRTRTSVRTEAEKFYTTRDIKNWILCNHDDTRKRETTSVLEIN